LTAVTTRRGATVADATGAAANNPTTGSSNHTNLTVIRHAPLSIKPSIARRNPAA
jgi:hypothetical protein